MCKRASQKLHALARISTLMSFNQRKIIMNAFITSQFNYCPLIWMCHSRTLETQINRIHERALKIVYRENDSSFETLLKKSGSVTIHHRNVQLLATEIFKALNNLSSSLMSDLFKIKDTKYDFRKGDILEYNKPYTVTYGIQSISQLAPKIWDIVPQEIKLSKTINVFKKQIKTWTPDKCPCKLCKTYVNNVGFIN